MIKLRKACFSSAFIMLFSLLSTSVQAVTWDWDATNEVLSGANDVVVTGYGTFDIEFLEGTCVDIFSGCDSPSDFDFNTQAGAQAAAAAILESVFVDIADGAPANFDTTDIDQIIGCVTDSCNFAIPYSPDYSNLVIVFNGTLEVDDRFNGAPAPVNGYGGPWVRFTPVSSVPVPAAVWLFGSGLLGLIGIARRKHSI